MKRIFIAVGSESLKGVTALVHRLCEENLFAQFDDRYIAIDSMASEVAAFNALGERLHTDRVKGFTIKIHPEDDSVRESFQPGWVAHDVPAGGVGGDRTISGKAVEFLKSIWNNADLQIGTSLEPYDQIVIVGSAFGGTSGGLFLNVCDFIDLQIRRKRDANSEYNNIQVLGFLLMPEAVTSQSDYPIAVNMISLFKDLQTSSWRRRLESERPGFKVPVWAQRERQGGKDYFPLFTMTTPGAHLLTERGVQGSSLPVSQMYIVPTPTNRRAYTTSILAEQLFAASYLRVDEGHGRWIDRLNAGNLGPAYQITSEDPCFAGFNMFVMKSGRMVSLKNWFYKSLIGVLQGENGHSGFLNGSAIHPIIPGNIKEVFLAAQMPRRDEALAGVDLEQCSALRALLDREHDAILNPKALLNLQSEFKRLLDAVREEVPTYEIIPAKELIAVLAAKQYAAWNKEINIDLIQKGYEAFHSEIKLQGGNVSDYADQLEQALHNALKYVQARVKNRVVRNWAFGLSQEDIVFREIALAFDQKFKALLKSYIYACRCARSPFIGVNAFVRETLEFRNACEQLKQKLETKCRNLRGGSNPFIVDGKLVEPLAKLPDGEEQKLAFSPLRIAMFVAYRACVSDSALNNKMIKDLQRLEDNAEYLDPVELTSDAVLEAAEERIVNKYLELSSKLQPGVNPLSNATLADFSEVKNTIGCKTHTKEFKLQDSNVFHYQFVVKQGEIPQGFHMSNSDVQSDEQGCLGLKTMPNTANGADAFLSTNHSIGMQAPNYWKDENTEQSKIFAGSKVEAEQLPVQGLWIGTLGIDFTANDILDRLYASIPTVKLEYVKASLRVMTPRTTITLSEMVRFGLVIEAIETKINEVWRVHKSSSATANDTILLNGSTVRISFENAGRVFELCSGKLSDFGFIDNPDGTCQLQQISVDWTGKILKWIRAIDASGFGAFYPSAHFVSVKNCETDIFTNMRLSITAAEVQEMDVVKNAIVNTIQIVGL